MRQKLLKYFSFVSLLLLVAVVAIWVRSYWMGVRVVWWTGRTTLSVAVNRGSVYLVRFDARYSGTMPPAFAAKVAQPSPQRLTLEKFRAYHVGGSSGFFGFNYGDGTRDQGIPDPPGVVLAQRWRTLTLPIWVAASLLAFLPAAWLRRWHWQWVVQNRVGRDACPQCGYDLRATPDRCPECGAVPAAR